MEQIIAKLRYFPLGVVAGVPLPILSEELEAIAKKYGVGITLQEITGTNLQATEDNLREETMSKPIEEVTQSVITITSEDEGSAEKAVRELIRKYRAPRTVYATWGSNVTGRQIIARACDVDDGWQ